MTKQTLGKLPPGAFGMLDLPALPSGIVEGYRALPDLTGTTSDVMDELGIVGAVPAAVLRPNDPTARVVGRALTVRNIPASAPVPEKVKSGVSGLGEIEAHNLAEPGDVLVVQGVDQVSNLGAPPLISLLSFLISFLTFSFFYLSFHFFLCSCFCSYMSLPFCYYCLCCPLFFSFYPRCHWLCWSLK